MKIDRFDKIGLSLITVIIITFIIGIVLLGRREARVKNEACKILLENVQTKDQILAYTELCK